MLVLLLGGLYWQGVCHVAGVGEPWDAARYWTLWYPAALALSALAGGFFPSRAWLAGMVFISSQIGVIAIQGGVKPLMLFGLATAVALAIPGALVSALAGRIGARLRRS